MTSSDLKIAGVYQIRCLPTGKVYIGSAVNLGRRWQQHRSSLRRGEHGNPYLQQAWMKYGEDQFEFSVLECVERDNLLLKEQFWIDQTGCTDRKVGFNVYPIAGSPGEANARVWNGFVDPSGNTVSIKNLDDFCRQQGLTFTAMRQLFKGTSKLKSHKGWTHRNSVRQREYIKTFDGFIDPEGQPVEPITNLAEFCRLHDLEDTHMIAVMRGRICSHRGWTHARGRSRQEQKTYTGFVDPQGERVTITNLAAYCLANGLHPVKMRQLKSGSILKYKGWIWRECEIDAQ